MQITFAEKLRPKLPMALMGCQLLKVSISKLDRSKMVNVLKTMKAHDDIIVNCDDENFGRMNMETAVRIWTELAETMNWECKDFLVFIGGTGDICEPVRTFKAFTSVVKIEELRDNCPILLDTDWFKKLSELSNKKRSLSDAGWSNESLFIQQSKKSDTVKESEQVGELHESNTQAPDLNSTFEEFRLQSQQMLEEQRQESENRMREMREHFEMRIQRMQEHQEFVATTTEGREKQNEDVVAQLQQQLRLQDHEKVLATQAASELQTKVQAFEEEKRSWQTEMAKMRDLIQSQKVIVKREFVQPTVHPDISFGSVGIDSDDEEIPNHSSPFQPKRKLNTVSKGLPTSLGKLGITVLNPARQTKIEYLSKFIMLVEDFNTNEDFKQIKSLIYQAFADDQNFRIQDLTSDDKSSLTKLAQAIIRQDNGDSVDLMKQFESEQLRHGETHLNYLHRMQVLYEFATDFSDSEWKKNHMHAQKIYNKIDDSLPKVAKSKFRELMMGDRKKSEMTLDKIRSALDTIIMIFGDELKIAMGAQRHVVPMVDAIQSKSQSFPSKQGVTCYNCKETGHIKRFCPNKGNNRESKTSGRKGSVQCFNCQGFGHISARCPTKREGHNKWNLAKENK